MCPHITWKKNYEFNCILRLLKNNWLNTIQNMVKVTKILVDLNKIFAVITKMSLS